MTYHGDFSNKKYIHKIYKNGYSSYRKKYMGAGEYMGIDYSVNGVLYGTATANASYSSTSNEYRIDGSGDASLGLSVSVTANTSVRRQIDIKGVTAIFNHTYYQTVNGSLTSYYVELLGYRINYVRSTNVVSVVYNGTTLVTATMAAGYSYIRMRESSGILYIDRSSDGATWTAWTNRTIADGDAMSSTFNVYGVLTSGGNGTVGVVVSQIDISDENDNILSIETSTLDDLQYTEHINNTASSTTLKLPYSPIERPSYLNYGNYVESYAIFQDDGVIDGRTYGGNLFNNIQYTNRSIYPSFEVDTGETVVVRTNYLVNPTFRTDTNGWTIIAGLADRILQSSMSAPSKRVLRTTASAAIAANTTLAYTNSNTGLVSPPATVFSGYIYHNASTPLSFYTRVDGVSGTAVSIPPNTWGRIVFYRPAGSFANSDVGFRNLSVIPSGTQIYLSSFMFETLGVLLPYFDGDINDGWQENDLTVRYANYSFTQTIISIMEGKKPAGADPRATAPAVLVSWLSSDGPNNGRKFARHMVTIAGGAVLAQAIDTSGIASSVSRTNGIFIRTSRNVNPTVQWRTSAGSVVSNIATFPTTSTWQEYRVTGSPATVDANIGFNFDSADVQSGDFIDLDNHFAILGTYTESFFDGNSDGSTWAGEENRSISYKHYYDDKSLIKFSGYIDTIDSDYDDLTTTITVVSHGELASNVLMSNGVQVESNVVQQIVQNTSESSASRRQTFTAQSNMKVSGVRLRISAAAGGSAQVAIGDWTGTIATSSPTTWSGALAAGVRTFTFNDITLEAGGTYWMQIVGTAGTVKWFYQNTDVYKFGSRQQLVSGVWSNVVGDAYFEIFSRNEATYYNYSGTIPNLVNQVFNNLSRNYSKLSIASVSNPGYNVYINASVDTAKTMLDTILKMSPSGYWYSFDLGTGKYNLLPSNGGREHHLILGNDFTGFKTSGSIGEIVNDVLFIGADLNDAQQKLAIRTTDNASAGKYKLGLSIESNGKVSRYDTAQLLSDYSIENNNEPRTTTQIVVSSAKYNTEAINIGDIVKVSNANNETLADGLLVASINYSPSSVTLSLDTAPKSINATVDQIKRDLDNTETSGVTSVV